MARVVYTDNDEYRWVVEVPDTLVDKEQYQYGIVLGPPTLELLQLNKELERKLSNALCDAGIYDYATMSSTRQTVLELIRQILPDADARDVLRTLIGIYQQHSYGLIQE